MKYRLLRFSLLSIMMMLSVMVNAGEWRDFAINLTDASIFSTDTNEFGVKVEDGGSYSATTTADADANIVIKAARFNDAQHGWVNCVFTIPVQGPVLIKLGDCQFGAQTGTIADSEGNVTELTKPAKKCWAASKPDENVVATYYRGLTPTTLTVTYTGYCPFIGVTAVDPADLPAETAKATVTFAAGEATGEVPAAIEDEVGAKITLPSNFTLYVEGKTLTAWSDGKNTFAPGAEYTIPETDATLTAVFTENEVALADRTEPVTIKWNFRRDQGAPSVGWEGKTGLVWVAQATVNGKVIDVALPFSTSPGKFNNASNTDWAQINSGTTFTVPSAKDATISMEAYSAITTTTIDGQTDYSSNKTVSYDIANSAETVDVVIGDGSYYRYIQVVLPKVEKDLSGAEFDNVAGSISWAVGNEEAGTVSESVADAVSVSSVSFGDALKVTTRNVFSKTLTDLTPNTSNAGTGAGPKVEYYVKLAKGLTFKPTSVSYDAVKVGTDNATYHYSYVIDGKESTKVQVSKDDIVRNNNTTGKPALNHVVTINEAGSNEFAFRIYVSGFANNKQLSIGNVVINGTVSGTVEDVAKFTLTPTPNVAEGGTVSAYPATAEYEDGTEVTLTATENFGYDFVNWTDQDGTVVSEEAKFKYTVKADAELTANFKKVETYELALTVEGGANDYMVAFSPEPTKVDGKLMYEEGTQVTLTASSNAILTFNNWSDGGTFAETKVTMDANKELAAVYSAVDYIVGWDFYNPGGGGRVADFASNDENQSAALVLRTEDGKTAGGLDRSVKGSNPGYEGEYGIVNWQSLDAKYYYQTMVNARDFSKIKVQARMLYNYNAYETQTLQWSTDGESWSEAGRITLPTRKWTDFAVTLPSEADHQATLYIRWIPDYTSEIKGASGNDGTSINSVYILAEADIYDDGTAPVLVSTIPVENATGASATGKIVLNYDEKVQLTDAAAATLNGEALTLAVSGKSVIAAYKNLSYETLYSFQLAAGSVADAAGNANQEAVTINFTTMTRPTVEKGLYDKVVNSADELLTALQAAPASERFRIFLHNGTYDLGNATLTNVKGNVSLIGESQEGVVIQNHPEAEGIGVTATLFVPSGAQNVYMQDITLKNAWDYTGTTGRAVCLQDKGDKTIAKNVTLLSYQDTYYSNNASGRFYWEDSEIHGTVDFLCGGGDVYYNRVNLVLEKRNGNVISAPNGQRKYGYVFLDCEINPVNDAAYSTVNGTFRLGRPWGADCRAQYINTKMNVLPAADGWGEMGGNKPLVFAEYNSTDKNNISVDLSSRKLTFDGGAQTSAVLTESQVEELSIANVMGGDDDWDPTLLTEQAPVPQNVKQTGKKLTWDDSNYALLWAVVKDGKVVDFTTEPAYTLTETGEYAVRAANEMGGLSEVSATVAVTELPATVSVKLNANGYATLASDKALNFADVEGLTAYIVATKSETAAELKEVTAVPAETGLVLKGEASAEYEIPVAATAEAVTGNLLKAAVSATTVDAKSVYVLDGNQFKVFSGREIPAGKAYLPKTSDSRLLDIVLGDATGISEVEALNEEGSVYSLSGQKVVKPAKGVYIVGGKKVVVK